MHGFSQKELTEGIRALEIGGLAESVSSIEQARSRRSHLHEQGADRAADQFVKTMEDCHKKITQARRKLEKEKPDIAKELQNLDKNWLTKAFMNMTRVARGKKPAVKPGRKAYEAVDDS